MGIRALVIVSVLALLAAPARGKPLADYEWVEVSTDEFTVRSIRGERATLKYARELALFLSVIPPSLQQLRHEDSGPITVYVLRYSNQVEELIHDDRPWYFVDNWYHGLPGERVMIIGLFTYGRQNFEYAFARYLFGGGELGDSLHWWQEALTSYFATAFIRDGDYHYARKYPTRMPSARTIRRGLRLALTPTVREQLNESDRQDFEYYAYRILRFLIDETDDWGVLAARLGRYISMVDKGADYVSAFETAFQYSMDELVEKVHAHSRHCCPGNEIPLQNLAQDYKPHVTVLDHQTISAALEQISAAAKRQTTGGWQ